MIKLIYHLQSTSESATRERSSYFEMEEMKNEKMMNLLNCSHSRTFYLICLESQLQVQHSAWMTCTLFSPVQDWVWHILWSLQHSIQPQICEERWKPDPPAPLLHEEITMVRDWGTGRPGFRVPEAGDIIVNPILCIMGGAHPAEMYGCCTFVCDQ